MRQLTLLKKDPVEYGGDTTKGRRKGVRPFSPRASLHVVVRSHRARGTWSLLHRRNRATIDRLVYKWAAAKRVKIYRYANVGNHLHLLVRAERREELQAFLKTFAGLAARAVTGAQKGIRTGKFWDQTAYSRIVPGGAFRALCAYFGKNRLEAVGFGGARLRIRADGSTLVVIGDPGEHHAEVERLIRGAPG